MTDSRSQQVNHFVRQLKKRSIAIKPRVVSQLDRNELG